MIKYSFSKIWIELLVYELSENVNTVYCTASGTSFMCSKSKEIDKVRFPLNTT